MQTNITKKWKGEEDNVSTKAIPSEWSPMWFNVHNHPTMSAWFAVCLRFSWQALGALAKGDSWVWLLLSHGRLPLSWCWAMLGLLAWCVVGDAGVATWTNWGLALILVMGVQTSGFDGRLGHVCFYFKLTGCFMLLHDNGRTPFMPLLNPHRITHLKWRLGSDTTVIAFLLPLLPGQQRFVCFLGDFGQQ